MQKKIFQLEVGGKTLTAEFNDLVLHANGSVLMRCGDTVVLVTAVMGEKLVLLPYLPLSVEFEEKFYAAGEILGSRFIRREGKPSDEAVLAARLIDRTIRPLFPTNLRYEVQVIVTVLAIGSDDPDLLGVIGASLALMVSDIPWQGPVGAVRLSRTAHDTVSIIYPTYTERGTPTNALELIACGHGGGINMIETAAHEVSEDIIMSALSEAQAVHTIQEQWQLKIVTEIGKTKRILETPQTPPELEDFFTTNYSNQLKATVFSQTSGKEHLSQLTQQFIQECATTIPHVPSILCADYFENQLDEVIHMGAVTEGKRACGRGLDDIRPLYAEAGGISPVLHGSGIFYRGETHVFSALTLGGPDAAQVVDTMEERSVAKRFMHHYNFPPFSVGETGRVGGFNRRMIGHGALAEKALLPVIPDIQTFPYTIRLVSETLSSNGSSSMASVCAASLALMDGGVPITRPVAGIASGVMFHNNQYALLTDIQGPEDEYGDMDLKVAGTTIGVTALQMDVKVAKIPLPVISEALNKARSARLHILQTMAKTIATPRAHISPRAPEIVTLVIPPEQIGLVIGSGGKTVNAIKTQTGVTDISIEDDGRIFITGNSGTATAAAHRIALLTKHYEVGETLTVTVTKITPFGAFAALDQYHEGLIHISELRPERVATVSEILTVGQEVPVIVTKVAAGKIGLSIKQCNPNYFSPANVNNVSDTNHRS